MTVSDEVLRVAKEFESFLDYAPNGLEHDLVGKANVFTNAPLALIQCGIQAQVSLLMRLRARGLLLKVK